MASKLHQLQSKATQASKLASKHASSYYKQLLEKNKQYIQEPPTVEKCQLLSDQLFYTRLARFSPYITLFYCNIMERSGIMDCLKLEHFVWLIKSMD